MKEISVTSGDSAPSTSPSTPSTPSGNAPSVIEQDYTDEPIHIINISIQFDSVEDLNDNELTLKCYQFVQVSTFIYMSFRKRGRTHSSLPPPYFVYVFVYMHGS